MDTIPDYMFQYLIDSIDISIQRAKTFPNSMKKEMLLIKLNEANAIAKAMKSESIY